ncbi:hypothetical protein DYH09_27810, partial [bacterium CPR1]|nr:hypothetical protein [bacterium CPR1]
MIRREFHAGPRGSAGHAPIDHEAEELIRARLTAAFPDWGYRGEETGAKAGSDPDHWWVVDPQDGTAAFQLGFRGSTVSIGLLQRGRPVLGTGGSGFCLKAFLGPVTDDIVVSPALRQEVAALTPA